MSDSALRYVPTDPSYRPSAEAARDAELALNALLPSAEAIAARFSDAVLFVDAGGNWEGVRCPECGANAEGWWSDAMCAAAETQFRQLMTIAPCCGAEVSLNGLDYGWAVAFGSFFLEAFNPQAPGLTETQLHSLSSSLGCEMREVKVHL